MANIAIIDDSPATLDALASILSRANHQVASFQTSEDLEAALNELVPDLILLDIVMPGRNGYELLRSFRKHELIKNIPVVLVSTKSEDTDIRWGLRQGAVDYITKPFTETRVLEVIEKQLEP